MDVTLDGTAFGTRPELGKAPTLRARDRLVARWASLRLDRALAEGVSPEASGALSLRAQSLAGRARRELGVSVRRILRRPPASASIGSRIPASWSALDKAGDDMDLLARRLLATAPVDVRGVAQARVLLSEGSGPLFWRRSPESLRARIREAIEALEPQTPHRTARAGGNERRR
jgi:hypothetical protein